MDLRLQDGLRRAFSAAGARYGGAPAAAGGSALYSALCHGLGAGPSPAAVALFDRYYRILSVQAPDVPLLLAALHHLSLIGDRQVTRFFPSCGGSFDAGQQEALVSAAEADLADRFDEVLDFMLSREPVADEVAPSVLILLGALEVGARFPGGLSVVELGAGGGARLLFDRYRYRFGGLGEVGGDASLTLAAEIEGNLAAVGALLTRGLPRVISAIGFDEAPRNLTDADERLVLEAFLPPDDALRLERLRAASAVQERAGRPPLHYVALELDFARLLTERYNEMPSGNTLLLVEAGHWSGLSEESQKRQALAVQGLAAHLQPQKPLAWLQVEPSSYGLWELKLRTFGWADREDRAVLRLAEADPQMRWIRWLG